VVHHSIKSIPIAHHPMASLNQSSWPCQNQFWLLANDPANDIGADTTSRFFVNVSP